jgi:hypothetical protein
LFTSLKVCNESKYTDPVKSVSAKTGTDVMNDAINRNFATMPGIAALSGNFIRLFEQRIGQLLRYSVTFIDVKIPEITRSAKPAVLFLVGSYNKPIYYCKYLIFLSPLGNQDQ